MRTVVLLRMVPDAVEDLEIAPSGTALDLSVVRLAPFERDEHALEQALLLKERHGGTVSVVAPDAPEVDAALFTALARGADRAVKLVGDGVAAGGAALFARALPRIPDLLPADLILAGFQTLDDLEGQVPPMLAELLGLPYLGLVTQVTVEPEARAITAVREYAGGVRGEFELRLPALLGIQAAERPPRYVPVAKVRATMKSRTIETAPVETREGPSLVEIRRMARPQAAARAEMLDGSPQEIAERICAILAERGLV